MFKLVCLGTFQAGIGSPENPERVVIALEPEAASVYCRKLKVHQLVPDVPPSNRIFFLRENVQEINLQPAVDEERGEFSYQPLAPLHLVERCSSGCLN